MNINFCGQVINNCMHFNCGRSAMFLVLLLQLVLLHGAVGDQVEISLNGDSWSLSDTDGRMKAIKAQVPGSVHLDLVYERPMQYCILVASLAL